MLWWVLGGLGAVYALMTAGLGSPASAERLPESFVRFQRRYLVTFVTCLAADWLQGPYVYSLYESYGFDVTAIAYLFLAGYGSSLVFGTLMGSMADRIGRKKACLTFCVLYALSCLTKISTDFWTLFVGRVLSGIATSIMHSGFEAWMVSAHRQNGFHDSLLVRTFALCTSYNGMAAVASGVAASTVAGCWGPVAPFLLALLLLVLGGVLIGTWWTENYGNSGIAPARVLLDAWRVVRSDRRVALLGAYQSLFEGTLFTFVFIWTPALRASTAAPRHVSLGLVFACYMVAVMIGSALFARASLRLRAYLPVLYVLAGAALLFTAALASRFTTLLTCFILFELCCGVHFPCIGSLRAALVPSTVRAGVMNLFRVPLNVIVLLVLLRVRFLGASTVLLICAALLLASAACAYALLRRMSDSQPGSSCPTSPLLKG